MKIIKHGTPQTATKLFVCDDCGCEFEANKGEYKCAIYDTGGEVGDFLTFSVCPDCGGVSRVKGSGW